MLLDDVRERLPVADVVRAAPAVARVYLRLAPPPDGAEHIVSDFPEAALERFHEPELVQLGLECLHVARVNAAIENVARTVFVHDALDHGEAVARGGRHRNVLVVCARKCAPAIGRSDRGSRGDLPLRRGVA